MLPFEHYNPTEIIFGRGCHRNVGEKTRAYTDTALLVYGGGSVKKTGVLDAVCASLEQAGVRCELLGGVQPNPRLAKVQEGIRLCREKQLRFVLAVGGGSVIDSAKAIGMGACYDGDVWDFYCGKVVPQATLPVGVVLTIPAAGSESSDGSVITKEEGLLKRSCCGRLQYPKFAMLNPELCVTLPKSQISAGGSDMIAHVLERYFSDEPGTDVSDRLCESVLRSLMMLLPRVYQDPDDVDAWSEIMWAGNIAHNGLLGRGRREDWACHPIEHELSALYDIAHGAGLAIVFPAWMKTVFPAHRARFVQFAMRVMDVSMPMDDEDAIIREGISRFERFLRSIGAPVRLSEAGLAHADIPLLAKMACGDWTLGSFEKLDAAKVETILRTAL